MFTGIIEDQGTVRNIEKVSEHAIQLTITSEKVTGDMQIGDSIAVNGICLTVTRFTTETFEVDVMPETIKATALNALTVGSRVNLERAITGLGRFGGHFVSGHIDGIGDIMRRRPEENAIYYDIQIPEKLSHYVLMKGSIAIDGISLTVFGIHDNMLTISLIPHTVSETILGDKECGDIVNIECDMLAKYVENMLKKTATLNAEND